jgi:mercuric ion transport protein
MSGQKRLKVGIVGTVTATLCCFTPVFVVVLEAIGLSAVLGIVDSVLMPALVIFTAIMVTLYENARQQPRTEINHHMP